MPALTVWGQRLGWLADDDLRVLAQRSFWMRLIQLTLLIPSGILLAEVDRRVEEYREDCATTTVIYDNNNKNVDEDEVDRLLRTVWTFWALSVATFVAALGLESWIWIVAGRGSPVQTEQRKVLPQLCAVKLVPLALLRVAAVILAIQTMTTAQKLCSLNPGAACRDRVVANEVEEEEDWVQLEGDPTLSATAVRVCPSSTKPTLLALAVLHMLEAGVSTLVVGILLLKGACSQGRKRHKQFEQWLSLNRFCNALSARRNDRGTTGGGRSSSSGWWHNCCQFCCLLASCCTCCMFGGSEVVQNSCGCGGSSRQQQQQKSSSCLADVSLVLADFFDKGVDDDDEDKERFLDVAPSDILVGLRLLATEQSLQMRQRLEQLEQQAAPDEHVEIGPNPESPNVISSTSLASGFVDRDDDLDLEKNIEEKEQSSSSDTDSQATSGKASSEAPPTSRRRQRASVLAIRLMRDDSKGTATFSTYERKPLVKDNLVDRGAIIEGAHYIGLAQGVYGHMMYFKTHTCSAPCCLMAGVGTCRACRCDGLDKPTVIGDNLCRLNELAMVRVANVKVEDVVYCSFQTGVERCPYAIVVDKAKKTVVLAVRGTFSLEAFATDLSIRPERLDDYRDRCEGLNHPSVAGEYCHLGMLKCAFTIYDDLKKLDLLDQMLLSENARFPDFELVITGHSLGAGVAAILGILLRTKFSTLRCLCFAPPGCVLSERAAAQDFITSYVLGVDLVPRLSLHSIEGLRDDVLLMIARIKVPKHVAFRDGRELGLAAKDRIQSVSVDSLKTLAYERDGTPESSFYDHVRKFKQHQQKLKSERPLEDVQLCPPGRIVHLVENRRIEGSGYFDFLRQRENRYIPVWADKADLSEIQISRTLIDDHSPDRYMLYLGIIAERFAQPE